MSASPYKVEVLPVPVALLGEGPHWDASTQELIYVDIFGKSVHRFNPVTGQERRVVIDDKIGDFDALSFVIPVKSQPDTFLIAYNGDIRVLKWPAGQESVHKLKLNQLKIFHLTPPHNPPRSVNDGKCDSKGRLWTGTICVEFQESLLKWNFVNGVCDFYRFDTDGKVSTQVEGVDISNGLAWSPDNKQLHFIDSGTGRVDTFDYDLETGTISNRRPAFDFKMNNLGGFPDGMCIDSNGNLWIAAYTTGVINVDPRTGELLRIVEIPGNKRITSMAFGGQNLDVLFVTSASFDLSDEEKAAMPTGGPGSVYKVTGLGVKGTSAGIPYAGTV